MFCTFAWHVDYYQCCAEFPSVSSLFWGAHLPIFYHLNHNFYNAVFFYAVAGGVILIDFRLCALPVSYFWIVIMKFCAFSLIHLIRFIWYLLPLHCFFFISIIKNFLQAAPSIFNYVFFYFSFAATLIFLI